MEDFNLALHRFSSSVSFGDGVSFRRRFSPKLINQECECNFCLPAVFHPRSHALESPQRTSYAFERSQRIMVLHSPLMSIRPERRLLMRHNSLSEDYAPLDDHKSYLEMSKFCTSQTGTSTNGLPQDYTHPDDRNTSTSLTLGFKSFKYTSTNNLSREFTSSDDHTASAPLAVKPFQYNGTNSLSQDHNSLHTSHSRAQTIQISKTNTSSLSQGYTHPDDHNSLTTSLTTGFKPFKPTNNNSLSQEYPCAGDHNLKTTSILQTFRADANTNSIFQDNTLSANRPASFKIKSLAKAQILQTQDTDTNSLSQDYKHRNDHSSIPTSSVRAQSDANINNISQDYTHPANHPYFKSLSRGQSPQNSDIETNILSQDFTHPANHSYYKSLSRDLSLPNSDIDTDSLSQDFNDPSDHDRPFTSFDADFKLKPCDSLGTRARNISPAAFPMKDDVMKDTKSTHAHYEQFSNPSDVSYIKDIRTITKEQYDFLKNSTKTHALYDFEYPKDAKTRHVQFEDKLTQKKSKAKRRNGNETSVTPALKGKPLIKKKVCICSFCSKSFATTRALELHVRRHSGLRPYPCKFCDKSFYQPSERAVHMRTHTGARPYRCPHCLKLFRYSGDLKQHINIHTGQRPYQCETCSKAFTNHSTLRQHKRIHSGERPYHCKDCGKTYRYHSSLKQHHMSHLKKAALQALNMTSSQTASTGNDVKIKKENKD